MRDAHLAALLRRAARNTGKGLYIYAPSGVDKYTFVSYQRLLRRASENANALRRVDGFVDGNVFLIHFDNHYDNIEWFWSVVLAGGVPTMSTPLPNSIEQRRKHLHHLYSLLKDPTCLTRKGLMDDFACQDLLTIKTVDDISPIYTAEYPPATNNQQSSIALEAVDDVHKSDDIAALMLTSGSTGNAKAVCLSSGQIIAALRGKSAYHETREDDVFLSWINMDHVANLTEIHLHAMHLGCDQVQIPAHAIIQNPIRLLEVVSKHKVTYTFAPNFLLYHLETSLSATELKILPVDLSSLRCLISGGEANVVATGESLSKMLSQLGGKRNVIIPGFGMTETCAGSIYSKMFPDIDTLQGREFASLGRCVPGLKLRIVASDDCQREVESHEQGRLEISGPLVFKRYFNDIASTEAALTPDGWFRTGDLAFIDDRGDLNLSGRTKELMNINGVKYAPQALENAISEAVIPGIVPSCTIVFPYRPPKSETERVCVAYLPSYDTNDCKARAATNDSVCKAAMLCIGSRPYVLPLSERHFEKSTLGKLSRSKFQANLNTGLYALEQNWNEQELKRCHSTEVTAPPDEFEKMLMIECMDQFGFLSEDLTVETNILDLGATSIELLRWKKRLQNALDIPDIPVVTIITSPTIRRLAVALREVQKPRDYDPLVVLQSQGTGTPLWLVHPGIGEILVFINLAKYLIDRPIYALRAKGFDGQEHFKSIPEVLATFHDNIKRKQPHGPYAIAGYSYGTLLAFELTKRLTAAGDTIKFLGAFNLAPHVKWRMRQLDWVEALVNLSHFLQLLDPDFAMALSPKLRIMKSREEILSYVVSISTPGRLEELGLTQRKFHEWVDVAMNLHDIARDYDPSGMVEGIDVFVATPLVAVASSREEWMDKHLRFWSDFSTTPPRFHSVQGEHYTMLGPDNVHTFQKTLKAAMASRGI